MAFLSEPWRVEIQPTSTTCTESLQIDVDVEVILYPKYITIGYVNNVQIGAKVG